MSPNLHLHMRQKAQHFFLDMRHRLENVLRRRDPEDLHQARVLGRRLRESLRMIEEIRPQLATGAFRRKLRLLAGNLGRMRELDVALWYLASRQSPIPTSVRRAARPCIQRSLVRQSRKECIRLRRRIPPLILSLSKDERASRSRSAWFDKLTMSGVAGRDSIFAGRMVEKRLKKARLRFREIRGKEDVRRIHLFRISLKKLRYSVEILLPFLPRRWRTEWKRIKKIQSVLGRLHDDYVTGEILGRASDACRALQLDYKRQFRRMENLRMPWIL